MPNSDTAHSRDLRKQNAIKYKQQTIDSGGHDLRVLLDSDDYRKFKAILENSKHNNKSDVIREMINREYAGLPMNARAEQFDLVDQASQRKQGST